jgi:hypothetical protein
VPATPLDELAHLLVLGVLKSQSITLEKPGPHLVDTEGREMRNIRLAPLKHTTRLDILAVVAVLLIEVDRLPL